MKYPLGFTQTVPHCRTGIWIDCDIKCEFPLITGHINS